MALRTKYSETNRKIKYNLCQNYPNYDTPQDNKFQVSFNQDGLFHNQHGLLKYDKTNTKSYQQSFQSNMHQKSQVRADICWNLDSQKDARNSKNKVLSEITNTHQLKSYKQKPEKKHLVGSIKRNNKQSRVLQNKILHDQFFESGIDLEEIDQLSISKLQQMNARLNKVINKENNYEGHSNKNNPDYQKVESLSSNQSSRKTIKQKQQLDNDVYYKKQRKQMLFESQSTAKHANNQTKTRQRQQEETIKARQPVKQTSYIQFVFQILDSKKVGVLSKENCKIQVIPQEFKFIFGGIFTRIFLKKLTCNKREFVKLCTNSLKELNSQEVFDLLKIFIERYQDREKIFADQCAFFDKYSLQKYGLKVNNEPVNKLGSVSKQISSQCHLQLGQQCLPNSNFIQSNVISSKKNYQSQRFVVSSESKKDSRFIQQNQSLRKFDKNQHLKEENCGYKSASKQRISISEQSIEQHKKGLLQLTELEKKMQNALKQGGNAEKVMLSGTECLKFSQLVKHI